MYASSGSRRPRRLDDKIPTTALGGTIEIVVAELVHVLDIVEVGTRSTGWEKHFIDNAGWAYAPASHTRAGT